MAADPSGIRTPPPAPAPPRGVDQAQRLAVVVTTLAEATDEETALAAAVVGTMTVLAADGAAVMGRGRLLVSAGQVPTAAPTAADGPGYAVRDLAVAGWQMLVCREWPLTMGDESLVEAIGGALALTLARVHSAGELRQAFHDPLTGLPNRSLFLDRLEHACEMAERISGRLGLLFVDLDGFKEVNDQLGHAGGDSLLEEIGERIRSCLRDTDTPARLGGDEFAILVEGIDSQTQAVAVAERILEALRVPLLLGETEVVPGASIGVAMGGPKRAVPGELLRNADLAMYRAKRGGKGRHAVFEPSMHHAATAEESLTHELRRAVAQHEFVVAYQPVMRLTTERVVGFEALVRWVHPERGLLMPGTFVPAAESAGLISAIGQHVLDTACGALAHWQSLGAAQRVTMSINLSERQLYDPELPGMVAKTLSHHRLRPDALVLEITEATLMGNLTMSHQRLAELKGLGVRLALDDFGAGHSSGYLRDFSFDILKLDPSVIEGLGSDPDATGTAREAIEIGDNLRMRTLAEGVESRNQLTTLRRLGCELGQGFLFSRPLEAQEVAATMTTASAPRVVHSGADLITPDIARRLVQVPS